MRLIYPINIFKTGQCPVLAAIPESDYFYFTNTIQVPIGELVIDEVNPDNKALCIDLKTTQGKYDTQGYTKYYVLNNELYINDNWQEATYD